MVSDLFEPVPLPPKISQKAIDDAVKTYPQFHRGYVWFAVAEKYRAAINSRWAEVSQFCEPNFVQEMQGPKFYARLWELNLRYAFRDHILRAPSSAEPDVICSQYVVEGVVPEPIRVPDLQLDGRVYDYPTLEISSRITSVIVDKHKQLQQRMNAKNPRTDYSSTPYITGIGLPQREFREAKGPSGLDIVEEIIMGVGPIAMSISADGGAASFRTTTKTTMSTINGSEYEIAYFLREEYADISAVLWSSTDVPETSDIKILLNPNARLPIDPDTLPSQMQVITYSKNETGYTRDQVNNGWS